MCTSIFMKYGGGNITTRTLDWHSHFNSSIWAFPKNKERCSAKETEVNRVKWTSKYASLGVCQIVKSDGTESGFNNSGINECGLAVSTLWLAEAKYSADKTKEEVNKEIKEGPQKISATIWVQYMLDNYNNVEDAVKDWETGKYEILETNTPGEDPKKSYAKTLAHLFITDAEGKSAIFEYYLTDKNGDEVKEDPEIKGDSKVEGGPKVKLHIITNVDAEGSESVIIHKEDCSVMTNSPIYEKQTKQNYYWQYRAANTSDFDELILPGTSTSPDRFSRIDYYLNNINLMDRKHSIAQAFSLMRTVSSPIEYVRDRKEGVTLTTLWTAVFDNNNKKLYLNSSYLPSVFWCELEGLWDNEDEECKYFNIDDENFDFENTSGGNIADKMISNGTKDFPFHF